MTAAHLLEHLRHQGVRLWQDGDLLRVDAPAELATAELRKELARHKAEILAQLNQEVPISETRVLVRTEAGVEVVEVAQVSPPGPTRWEKRLARGEHVALVGEVTEDERLARVWVASLRAADTQAKSGDEGAA